MKCCFKRIKIFASDESFTHVELPLVSIVLNTPTSFVVCGIGYIGNEIEIKYGR